MSKELKPDKTEYMISCDYRSKSATLRDWDEMLVHSKLKVRATEANECLSV